MKKLPLHNFHLEKGAEFIESSGWLLPKKYDSVKLEYKSAKNGIAVIDFSSRGKIRLSGKECFKFMQGMLSNDVIKLQSGKGVYATLLNVKGKMIADLYLYKDGEQAFLDLEQGLNKTISDLLLKYRLSYKAKIEDVTDKFIQLCYIGPKSTQYLSELLNEDLSKLGDPSFIKKNVDDFEVFIVKVKRSSQQGFDLYFPIDCQESVEKFLIKESGGLKPNFIGLDTYEVLRVEAGIAKYGVDMNDSTIPIEAGLWDALNFEKGCYIGQEVIARIKWRGRVNRHLVGIELEGETTADPQDKILIDEKEIGFVTSSVYSYKSNKIICMAYLRREFKDPGTGVKVLVDNQKIDGKVFNYNN